MSNDSMQHSSPRSRKRFDDARADAMFAEAAKPTSRPRPDWMIDPSKLPKAPPSRPRLDSK